MSYHSVLFCGDQATRAELESGEPPFFGDLNLDQVVEAITAGREEYDLQPFFYTRLDSPEAIAYRHQVLRDLESKELFSLVASFARGMQEVRQHLAQAGKLRYKYEKQARFLESAQLYCDVVNRFSADLASVNLRSSGLLTFRNYLVSYVHSDGFAALLADAKQVTEGLSGVRYFLNIKGRRIKVSRYDSEADYSAEVDETFAKFKQGAVKDYRVGFSASPDMNHVEAGVLDLVARLHPDVFSALGAYCERHRDYLDETIAGFDREIQFYVAYLEYIRQFLAAGLDFCYPQVSDQFKKIHAQETFDIALANKFVPNGTSVVCNNFYLKDTERIIVVSGPNQGGKTTFARTFGQLHQLAGIGLLVPGQNAQLLLFDQLFTHFEKEEDITNLSGKLEDDLVRTHDMLQRATADSIVIMNETFTSTTLRDALVLGTAVMEQLIERGPLCVYVTFVDELASLGESTVSMVSTVAPEDPASRTYKVVRMRADGLAYAAALAEKYGLTSERLRERLAS
ncbi:MAG: MutS-related protein [Nocardioidaceae bacterium]